MFETRQDMLFFLGLVEDQVGLDRIEVHAYSLLPNHFHGLAVSLEGRISDVMRDVQSKYVRYFNRTRERDGPLVRGRFKSKVVESEEYQRTLVRYIDYNAVGAGLVEDPSQYPFCSAWAHYNQSWPDWLERGYIQQELSPYLGGGHNWAEAYRLAFGEALDPGRCEIIERRLSQRGGEDRWDDLVRGSPEVVLEWMRSCAANADGTIPGLAVASQVAVMSGVAAVQAGSTFADEAVFGRYDPWTVLRAALLRSAVGMTLEEIATIEATGLNTVRRRLHIHRRAFAASPGYAELATSVARRCFR